MKTISATQTSNLYGRFNPLNDYLFVKVMGEKGDEVQLLGFLNAVLDRTGNDRLASVEIIESKTFSAETLGDKSSILDVRAMLQDGTMVNIEVQLRNLGNMDRRSLFYWSKEFTKGIKAGQDYRELPNAIAINIINFQFLETENFHTVFHLREDNEHSLVLTDALEIHFLDMVKYRRQQRTVRPKVCGRRKDMENEPLHRWLAWLDENSPPELIAEVVGTDDTIKAAQERLVYVTGDDEAIRAYEMRQMALSDLTSYKNFAREEGLKEGREEGIKQGLKQGLEQGLEQGIEQGIEKNRVETARKMKLRGRPIDEIAEDTGLSIETIKEL